jgi:SAM-dependent methyltransferase
MRLQGWLVNGERRNCGLEDAPLFSKSQAYYDAIYGFKDYAAETARLCAVVDAHKRSPGNALLDVACGTGAHIACLPERFAAEGCDLDAGMIEIARARNPGIAFHLADMTDFDLGRRFDVVACLFSAVAYAATLERLRAAVAAMARHVLPGGVVIVEPFLTPDDWRPGRSVTATFANEPELKIARIAVPERDGLLVRFDFNYLVGTPAGVEHFIERHEVGLFTHEEYREAFTRLGLAAHFDEDWPTKRGIFIAQIP